MGAWMAPEATSGTASRNAVGIFRSMSGWFRKKPLTTMRFTIRSNGLIATVSDGCTDFVERAVFIHDHEVTADGLQLGNERRAAHEIDRLHPPRLGDGDKRPADT